MEGNHVFNVVYFVLRSVFCPNRVPLTAPVTAVVVVTYSCLLFMSLFSCRQLRPTVIHVTQLERQTALDGLYAAWYLYYVTHVIVNCTIVCTANLNVQ